MHKVELYKDIDGVVKIKGTVNYWDTEIKTVQVDGVTYQNKSSFEVTKDVEVFKKENNMYWQVLNFGVDGLFDLLAEDYTGFYSGTLIGECTRCCYSENPYIKAAQTLFEYGYYPSYVLNMFTSKNDRSVEKDVPIIITGYGFNNNLYCTISFRKFFSIEDKTKLLNYEQLKQAFKKQYNLDISKKVTINEIISLFKTKIQYATRKQQITTSLHF